MSETQLLTATELAERLKVKRQTILNWARSGVIPCLRLSGKVIRFDPCQVLQVMDKKEAPL